MFFAVDIDGVLARDTTGYATYMNRYFHLGIEQSLIDSLTSYAQFIELEAVRSFVRGNESRATEFNSVAKDAQYAPLVQQMRVPINGAVEAVQHIAQFYSFRYVTCRKLSTLPVTQEWLDRYGFPTPENVSCYEQGIHQKYLEAYHFAAADEPLIFIDDLARVFMMSFAALIKHHYQEAKAIRRRCTLLAFDHAEAPQWPFNKPMYPVWPLLDWGQFRNLVGVGEPLHV